MAVRENPATRGARDDQLLLMHADRLDRAGTGTSLACAVHCALSPFLLPLLPLANRHFVGATLEWAFALLSLALGVISLGHSYRAVHRDPRTLVLFVTGFTALMVVRVLEPPARVEWIAVLAAASFIIAAHLLNVRLRRGVHQGHCRCPCHDC